MLQYVFIVHEALLSQKIKDNLSPMWSF